MKPPRFDYVAAGSVDEAVAALANSDDARILAGGQSLVPLMNMRLARPATLVDINGIGDLDGVETTNGTARFGSIARLRMLESEPAVASAAPLIAEAAALVGHVHIRNRSTLGGCLAHADPAAELPAALVALDGQVEVSGPNGNRTIPASELYVGPFETSIEPSEMLVGVDVPGHENGDGTAFSEFALRHGDFAVAGIAVALSLDTDGSCTKARMAGCGLGSTPIDLSEAASTLTGEASLGSALLDEVAHRVGDAVEPPDDLHGSSDYRRQLAQVLAADAVQTAWTRAGGAQ